MNHRTALCFSLAVLFFIYESALLNAGTEKNSEYGSAVFSDSFDSMNIPDESGTITPQIFENAATYLLKSGRYDWLSFYIERAPNHYFRHYAEFRIYSRFGHTERARTRLIDFVDGLKKELAKQKTDVRYDAELASAFAWLREREFDSDRKLLDELCQALPGNHSLAAERIRWTDWLDGRPAAINEIEKLRKNEKSDIGLLIEAAGIYGDWLETDRAVRLFLEAWQRAENDEDIWEIYRKSVAINVPALEKKLAERILNKDRSLNSLKTIYENGNISTEKLKTQLDSLLKQNSLKDSERTAAAELLLKAKDRKKAAELAESISSEGDAATLIAKARLFAGLHGGEVEQDKLRLYSGKKIEAIKRLVSTLDYSQPAFVYRVSELVDREERDAENYRLLRPLIDKLRTHFSGAYMQLQELRLLQQAGKNEEVLAGLNSLYKQHADKPLLQIAVVSEAIRFIEDGLEDAQDGRLRKWCEDKTMATADTTKDGFALSICAELLDRISKRGEAANIRQKLALSTEASNDLIIEMSAAMLNSAGHERIAGTLKRIRTDSMEMRHKLMLIEILYRCDEQERATSLQYGIAEENNLNNRLQLVRRLIPHFEKYRQSLSYLTQTARISLDVFSHQIIMLLRKHCESENIAAADFAEAFSILRRMQADLSVNDARRDSETRFYMWENSGAVEEAVYNIFELIPVSRKEGDFPAGTAAELARLANSDFLDVLKSQKEKGPLSATDMFEITIAAAIKSPEAAGGFDSIIEEWKNKLEQKTKAAEFFEMALSLNSAALTAEQNAEERAAHYRKIRNRMESEKVFWEKLKNNKNDDAQQNDAQPVNTQMRLQINKDPRQHILSASQVEAAVRANTDGLEHCFKISHDGYPPEFKGFIITDPEGFVENADVYSLNSSPDLHKCIKERLHAVYVPDIEAPFGFAHLDFKYVKAAPETENEAEKDADNSGLRLAQLEELKSKAEKQMKIWSDWPDEIQKRSNNMLELALDLSADSKLQKKIAGWQFINGQEDEARRTLHMAIWTQVGNWLGIMTAVLAAFWLAAYFKKRIKNTKQ